MSETLQNMLPVSLLYALPLIPVFIYFWWMQYRNNRVLDKMTQVETETVASEAAKKLLNDVSITDIVIEKSSDYSQNEYVSCDRKILLGPDTFDQKDLTAISLAVRAAGKAILEKESPESFRLLDILKRSTLVFFWFVFTVLAFGLMGNSMVTVVVGYLLFALMLIAVIACVRMERGVNRRVLELISQDEWFPADLSEKLRTPLNAEATKF